MFGSPRTIDLRMPCIRLHIPAALMAVIAILATLPAMAHAATAPWAEIASPGSTSAAVNPIPDIAWDGTGLWATWGTDVMDVEVRRWNGTSWASYPQPVNETTRNKMPSITWDGTRAWVAWNDDSYAVRVAYWNGSAWVQVASPGTATSINATPDLHYANGSVHVAYQDSSRVVQVERWNGSSWVALASPGSGGTANAYPSLGWDGTNVFVAWAQPNLVVVSRLVGAAWSAHSTLATPAAPNPLPTIEFIGSRLYVAYETGGTVAGYEWWDGVQYRPIPSPGGGNVYMYPTLEWTGSRLWASYVVDPGTVTIAWYDPVAPNAPTSLAQFQSDGTTSVAGGAWTRFGAASPLVFRGSMRDAQSSEQLLPWYEVRPTSTALSSTCGQQVAGATFIGTQVAAPTGGTAYTGSVDVTGLTNNTGYWWRMCIVDRFGFPSTWTALGGSPDVRVDTSLPTAAPSTPASAATNVASAPTLTAAYTDPAPANPGTVAFEVCTTNTCGTVVRSGTSSSIASGTDATWTVPSALTYSTTYWWRTRATDSVGNVGAWSATRSFTTEAASISIGVDAPSRTLGTAFAGSDVTGTSVVSVTADSPGGYRLVARDESDAWGADTPGGDTLVDWTGTAAAPTQWNPGVAGGFGITMLAATGLGAKDARWGTGTQATDLALNRYAGLDATVDGAIHQRTSFAAGTDTVTLGWRVNVPTTQPPGDYEATIAFTAIPLP